MSRRGRNLNKWKCSISRIFSTGPLDYELFELRRIKKPEPRLQ